MNDFGKLYNYVNQAEGWLSPREARFLYQVAKEEKKGKVVEIGSFLGKSTICLAYGSKEKNQELVYAVDPHKGIYSEGNKKNKAGSTYAHFRANLKSAGVDDWVIPVRKTSQQASRDWKNKKIRLLFIDGLHDYKHVSQDYELWSKSLVDGGIIAFHDAYFGYEGPTRVFTKNILQNPNFSSFGIAGSILYARKEPAASFWAKLHAKKYQIFLPFIFKLGKLPMPNILSTLLFHKFFSSFLNNARYIQSSLLVGALITATILRVWGIAAGLPNIVIHMDERALIYTTLAIIPMNGVLWTIGPGLFIPNYLFLLYGVYFVFGKMFGIFSTPESFYISYLKDPTYFYLIGRMMTVLFGISTVWLVYKAGRRWFNERIGLIAAWFLAVSFLHVKESHYIKGDVLGGFIAILLFHLSCKIAQKPKLRNYVLSGVLTGIGVGVKYFTAIPFVMVLGAHILVTNNKKSSFLNRYLIIFIATSVITVFLQSPLTFIMRNNVLKEFIGWGQLVSQGVTRPSIPVALKFAEHIREGIGTWMFLLALAGIIFAIVRIRQFKYFLLILFPFVFLSSVEFWAKFNLPRYSLVLFPAFVLFAAIGIDVLATKIKKEWLRNAVVTAIVIAALIPTGLRSIKFNRYMEGLDTGSIAKAWIEKNIPEGSKIAVEGMLRPELYGAVPLDLSVVAIEREIIRAKNNGIKAITLYALRDANKEKIGYDIFATTRLDLKRDILTAEEKVLLNDASFYVNEGYKYVVLLNWAENPPLNGEFVMDFKKKYKKIAEFKPTVNFSASPHIEYIQYEKVDDMPLMGNMISGPTVEIYFLKMGDMKND